MKKNFNYTDIIPAELREQLTEESLLAIKTGIENLVEAKVAERIDIAVKSNQDALDEAVSKDIQVLVQQIEECHYHKATRAISTLKEKYAKKIRLVREYYQKKVDKESKEFKNQLVESINSFIDKNIKKLLPIETIKEAVRNNSAIKVVQSLKNVLNVNEASVMDSIKEPVLEANSTINTLTKDNQVLVAGYKKLQEENRILEAKAFLSDKCHGLNETVRNRVMRALDGQSLEYIRENFDYAVKCVKKEEEKSREQLKESTIKERIKTSPANPSRGKLVTKNVVKENKFFSHDDYMKNILESVD